MRWIQRSILGFFLTVMVLTGASRSHAGERERDALLALLGKETANEQMFAPAFLAQVPFTQIQAITSQIRSSIGNPIEIVEQDKTYLVKSKTHEMPTTIVLDENGKIIGLLFRAATLTGQSDIEILTGMNELGGDIAYLAIKDGKHFTSKTPMKSWPLVQHSSSAFWQHWLKKSTATKSVGMTLSN